MLPSPPSWFVKKLKAINASLGVRHAGSKGWQIVQMVKEVADAGSWNGHRLCVVKPVAHHVGYYPQLGSRILHDLPRHNTARYRRYEDFCEELNIRYK